MLLSGNAEVSFPSTTATTTPAANLPTATAAAAPVDVLLLLFQGLLVPLLFPLIGLVPGSLAASAAANAAYCCSPSTACPKRRHV
jgi:hypothetical protein